MRILIAALGLAMLAGCASMNERRAEGPARSFTSQRDVTTVAECVLFAWQNQSLAGVHYDVTIQPLPSGGKTVVSAGQIEFADFTKTDRGSSVDLYFQSGLMDWRKNRRIEAVNSCL